MPLNSSVDSKVQVKINICASMHRRGYSVPTDTPVEEESSAAILVKMAHFIT